MPELNNIAIMGLQTAQTALTTTGHNIANVGTEGYSRQRIQIAVNPADDQGNGSFGNGAQVIGVQRLVDKFIIDQIVNDTQSLNEFEALYDAGDQVSRLLGSDATSMGQSIQDFFSAVQNVSNDPASVAARQVLLSEGENISNRFNILHNQLSSVNTTLNDRLSSLASDISAIAQNIAELNGRISTYSGQNIGTLPNDLLDQREQQIRSLSELVGITTIEQSDLTTSIFIGSGQSLVIGNTANALEAAVEFGTLDRNDVIFVSGSTRIVVSEQVTGGQMGGVLRARERMLDPAFNQLGRLAMATAETFNEQHRLGMDLVDDLGVDFFNPIDNAVIEASRVSAQTGNTGTAQLSVTVDNIEYLDAVEYSMAYDGAFYTLSDPLSGNILSTFAEPAIPGTVTINDTGGNAMFTINFLSGNGAADDNWMLTPSRFGALDIRTNITDTSQVAAAAPIRVEEVETNTGTGNIVSSVVSDTTTAPFATTARTLTPPLRVEFTSTTAYNIVNATTSAVLVTGATFTPNADNNIIADNSPALETALGIPAFVAGTAGTGLGYEVTINGEPSGVDVFTINYNNGGRGDNRNALSLAALQTTRILDGNTTTYKDAYSNLVSSVGTRTRDAEISVTAAESILRQSTAARESVSGVNLDEEASNLVRYQQAYEASARIIRISSEVFQSLLSVI